MTNCGSFREKPIKLRDYHNCFNVKKIFTLENQLDEEHSQDYEFD